MMETDSWLGGLNQNSQMESMNQNQNQKTFIRYIYSKAKVIT